MRETRLSGSEGGGANPIVSPYPYHATLLRTWRTLRLNVFLRVSVSLWLCFHVIAYTAMFTANFVLSSRRNRLFRQS
jgi:hypothetical protein